jgi:ubiquinone/menaquinone biosynthesis C-methylase UbiE
VESPDPMPSNHAETQKASAMREFEKWALSYDRSIFNELLFFPCVRACQEEILRWQQTRSDQPYHVLDVGCGTGTLCSVLSSDPRAERLVGLDYSPTMVARAADKFSQIPDDHRHKLEALQGDAEQLPFEPESFDVVTCCNSFHHYPHQADAIAGFYRILKPGGLLLLLDGFRDNIVGWFVFDVVVEGIEKHVHHAAWSEVRDWIQAAGFANLRQRKMNVLAPVLVNIARK